MPESLTIRVPATSANFGPGFDTLGIALSLYNTFVFTPADMDSVSGCKTEYSGKDNLTLRAFRIAAQKVCLNCLGIHIDHKCEVPDARGLGSSSTCIVAGVAAAFALAGRGDDKQAILDIATELEGHPDNVAPAILGGLTVSVMEDGKVKTIQIPMAHDYKFIALIPPFSLSTRESRAVLPEQVSRQDAVCNISHVALLIGALVNGDDAALKLALHDCLHQSYRGKLIPHYDEIMTMLNANSDVLGAYLSGAGPTIIFLIKNNIILNDNLMQLIAFGQVLELSINELGFEYK